MLVKIKFTLNYCTADAAELVSGVQDAQAWQVNNGWGLICTQPVANALGLEEIPDLECYLVPAEGTPESLQAALEALGVFVEFLNTPETSLED